MTTQKNQKQTIYTKIIENRLVDKIFVKLYQIGLTSKMVMKLYEKYGLDMFEREYIESLIKPLD